MGKTDVSALRAELKRLYDELCTVRDDVKIAKSLESDVNLILDWRAAIRKWKEAVNKDLDKMNQLERDLTKKLNTDVAAIKSSVLDTLAAEFQQSNTSTFKVMVASLSLATNHFQQAQQSFSTQVKTTLDELSGRILATERKNEEVSKNVLELTTRVNSDTAMAPSEDLTQIKQSVELLTQELRSSLNGLAENERVDHLETQHRTTMQALNHRISKNDTRDELRDLHRKIETGLEKQAIDLATVKAELVTRMHEHEEQEHEREASRVTQALEAVKMESMKAMDALLSPQLAKVQADQDRSNSAIAQMTLCFHEALQKSTAGITAELASIRTIVPKAETHVATAQEELHQELTLMRQEMVRLQTAVDEQKVTIQQLQDAKGYNGDGIVKKLRIENYFAAAANSNVTDSDETDPETDSRLYTDLIRESYGLPIEVPVRKVLHENGRQLATILRAKQYLVDPTKQIIKSSGRHITNDAVDEFKHLLGKVARSVFWMNNEWPFVAN